MIEAGTVADAGYAAPTVQSSHWVRLRLAPPAPCFTCGCGAWFLWARELVAHVAEARKAAA